MRILVTGSAGHVGKWQVDALRDAGYMVRTFDRAARLNGQPGDHIAGDLRNIQTVRHAVQEADAVVHMGAISFDTKGTPEDILSVNVQGTWNLLLACAEAGIKRFVYFSSVHSLGNFGGYRQAGNLPIDDAYPRHPLSAYQLSKHLAEETCRAFTDLHGISTLCLRPVFVAHPEYYHHWRNPVQERRGDYMSHDYWAYVDVRDVCDATLRCLKVEGISHDAFLLAARDTLSNVPTAELVRKYYGDTPWEGKTLEEYTRDEPYRSLIDCSHARAVLGWEPKYIWRSE